MSKRNKTPTILQMEATECGAAALSIIMAYYGRYIPLEEMRVQCGVSRDGSKALNMLKAARSYGLTADAAKVSDLEAFTEIDQPCIVFWEFNHFVVVERLHRNKFYINDPATGPRVISREEFGHSFTGIVLLIEPSENFAKGGKAPGWFSSLQRRLQNANMSLLFIMLASLGLVLTGFLAAAFGKIFIDDILIADNQRWLLPLLTGMLVTAVIRGTLTWLQQYYLLRLQVKLMVTNSAKFFFHVLTLPLNFFQQRYAGDIAERVGANTRIAQLLSEGVSINVVNLITSIFFGVILLLLSWPLALLTISITMLNGGLLLLLARKIADKSRKALQDEGKLSGVEMNGISIIETLKSSGLHNDFFTRWSGTHAKTINNQQAIMLYSGYFGVLSNFLLSMLNVFTIGIGCWLITQGELTVGSLVAFQSIAMSFTTPIMGLLSLGEEIQQVKGDLTRLDDVMKHPKDPQLTHQKLERERVPDTQSSLKFQQVSFGYSMLEEPFLQDFNADIPTGSRVALVGSSGSGKSTLAKLAAGLLQPWQGRVLLDEVPIQEIEQSVLASSLASVDQDISLFIGTVRDNLTLWNRNILDKHLLQALQDACLLDDITQRGGLGAMIGEDGLNFSGGQRQRLEIARALIHQPSFLILDEATSALDPLIEKEIYRNLKQRDCTILIIAHRLSAIRDCDQIIVLEKGRVVQRGTHETLFSQPGRYRDLVTGETGHD